MKRINPLLFVPFFLLTQALFANDELIVNPNDPLLSCAEITDVELVDSNTDAPVAVEDLDRFGVAPKVLDYKSLVNTDGFVLFRNGSIPENASNNLVKEDRVYTFLKIQNPTVRQTGLYVPRTTGNSRLLKTFQLGPHAHSLDYENKDVLMSGYGVPMNTESFSPESVAWQLRSISDDPLEEDDRYLIAVMRLTLTQRVAGQNTQVVGRKLMRCFMGSPVN